MRYLILAGVFLYITFTVGLAFAAQPKVGDVVETIYACKTESILEFVLEQPTEEDFNLAAEAGISAEDCLRAPGEAMVMSKVHKLLKVYKLSWAPLILYSFSTEGSKGTYYTFSYESAQEI